MRVYECNMLGGSGPIWIIAADFIDAVTRFNAWAQKHEFNPARLESIRLLGGSVVLPS